MKQTSINVQITKNLGNYESIRLGGEWSIEESENPAQVYSNALNELNNVYAQMFHVEQKEAENPQEKAVEVPKAEQKVVDGKQFISFKENTNEAENPQEKSVEVPKAEQKVVDVKQFISFKENPNIVQSICRRVAKDKNVTMETILQYYTLDEEARKIVELAIKIRK